MSSMCPSTFTPSCVQEGLIEVIHTLPQSQFKSPYHFSDLQSWLSHHPPRVDGSAGGGNGEEAG